MGERERGCCGLTEEEHGKARESGLWPPAPADLPPDPPRNSPEAVIRHDDDGTLSITFYPEDARWVVCSREVMEQYVTDLNALATAQARVAELEAGLLAIAEGHVPMTALTGPGHPLPTDYRRAARRALST